MSFTLNLEVNGSRNIESEIALGLLSLFNLTNRLTQQILIQAPQYNRNMQGKEEMASYFENIARASAQLINNPIKTKQFMEEILFGKNKSGNNLSALEATTWRRGDKLEPLKSTVKNSAESINTDVKMTMPTTMISNPKYNNNRKQRVDDQKLSNPRKNRNAFSALQDFDSEDEENENPEDNSKKATIPRVTNEEAKKTKDVLVLNPFSLLSTFSKSNLVHPPSYNWFEKWSTSAPNNSNLTSLPMELLTSVFVDFLACPSDLASFSQTCKFAASNFGQNETIWRQIITIDRFPLVFSSPFFAATEGNVKQTYARVHNDQQVFIFNGTVEGGQRVNLTGFTFQYTLSSKNEVNGLTIENKLTTTDELSSEYCTCMHHRNCALHDGETLSVLEEEDRFLGFVPIYHSPLHFVHSRNYVYKIVKSINTRRPQTSTSRFKNAKPLYKPELDSSNQTSSISTQVNQFMAKLITTQVMLIVDNGVALDRDTLNILLQMLRLWTALLDHKEASELRNDICAKTIGFFLFEDFRKKSTTPNLGELMVMSVLLDNCGWNSLNSKNKSWLKILLTEGFARKVFWLCRSFPQIASLPSVDIASLDEDEVKELILTTGRATGLSHRIYSGFFSLSNFLRNVIGESSSFSSGSFRDIWSNLDIFNCQPNNYQVAKFVEYFSPIHSITSWDLFYTSLGLDYPGDRGVLQELQKAVINSSKSGYHTTETDFNTIFRTNQSNILLRGLTHYNRSVFVIDTSGSMASFTLKDMDKSLSSPSLDAKQLYLGREVICFVKNEDDKMVWAQGHIRERGTEGVKYFDASSNRHWKCNVPFENQHFRPITDGCSRYTLVSLQLKEALTNGMSADNQFTLLLFSHTMNFWKKHCVEATIENVSSAIHVLSKGGPGGGTDLFGALEAAYNVNSKTITSVTLLTDGEVSSDESSRIFEALPAWSNNGKIPCHITGMGIENEDVENRLRQISILTNGFYKSVGNREV